MGLLAGILLLNSPNKGLQAKLSLMLTAQKHRDKGSPISVVEDRYALGMANSQDLIFEDNPGNKKGQNINAFSIDGVYAFVDGIVLQTSRHRKDFNDAGFNLRVCSCSAVICAAYKKWDMDFMNHLEGEFSCAVWDKKKQKLILVRDPYGHKPLHYYKDKEKLVFSSEIKGILASGVAAGVDMLSLSDYLTLNGIPYPATIFKNIKQVSPGNMIVLANEQLTEHKFWQHKFNINKSLSLENAVDELENKIREAVRKRMVQDDVHCFLSGGIDSSALLSFAAELSDKPVNAITVGFREEEKNELEFAKAMAQHVGAKHHYVIAEPDSFLEMLDKLVSHHDCPFIDTSAYPTFYAGKLARGFTDVILTGDGPDQTMGGSGHHVFAIKNNLFVPKNHLLQAFSKFGADCLGIFARVPSPSVVYRMRRKLHRDSLSGVEMAYELRSGIPNLVKKFICDDRIWRVHQKNSPYRHPLSWFNQAEGADLINKYLFADIRYYVTDDLMIKVDRMCMAHSLETLSPFQDVQLAKVVNAIPGKYKINVDGDGKVTTKYILKKICQKRFPEKVLNKTKQGFGVPLEKWLRIGNGKYLKEILLDSRSLNRGYFNKESMTKLVNDFINKRGDYFYPAPAGVVALLTFELWNRQYID